MSKNFEEEYRHMIEEDIPDLWDRIEAQLPNDSTAATEEISNSSEQIYSKQPDTVPAYQSYEQTKAPTEVRTEEYQSKKNNKKKIFTRRRFVAWGSLAAAVFAIFIIIPILIRTGGKSAAPMNEMHSNSAGAADVAEEPQSDGGMYDMEYAPMVVPNSIEQGYSYESAEDGYAPEPGAPSYEPDHDRQEGMLAGETQAHVITDEEYDNSETVNPTTEPHGNNLDGKETDMPEDDVFEAEGEVPSEIYQAEVKILSAITTEEGSILYEAEIHGDPDERWDSGWREGARLFLMFKGEEENDSAVNSVSVGRSYTVSIYSSGEEVERYGIGVSQPGNSESSVYRTGIYIISAVEKQTMQ